ncbi:hypothetical protein Ga0061061_11732 [Chelatococcus sambhunathii]|uniref:Uncharacterized protein n=1 Tax=Chelatococcus sambhunathii TaxID=363953 RepID=A0ABP2AB67_9HYPH|nr:hypothetical protein [Chelatococcus sambhunathii]CUA90983.1 hypothetical protein Ga0061061_11732 [Chelatococcus sambhunathii]
MKLHTPNTRLGNYFVARMDNGALTIVGASESYVAYEYAEAQLKASKGKIDGATYLIVQVVGEFKAAVQLASVHPM